MRAHSTQSGFTLIELVLACVVSSLLIAGIVGVYAPSASNFLATIDQERLKANVSSALDTIGKDAENQRAIYVDKVTPQCYEVCMVDGSSNRTIYFWQGTTLYRKKEVSSNPITCSGGTPVALGLEPTMATWSTNGGVLSVSLGGTGSYHNTYSLSTDFYPWIQERDVIFSEGFECDTLRQGWVVSAGTRNTWSIVPSSQHLGEYSIAASDSSSGSSSTSLSISLDLSRMTEAHLGFTYYNSGTIGSGDSYIVYLYDGTTWQQVFSDARGVSVTSPQPVTVDLSGYNLNASNQLKFVGTLQYAGASWYLDAVSVYAP